MKPYAERRQARIDGLAAGAAAARAAGEVALGAARATASAIPCGQPILVGHHSEKRHRRDVERIDAGMRKGFAALDHAADLERRAAAAKRNTAISSDDPDAIGKLRAKLAAIEAERERARLINATIRTATRRAKLAGVDERLGCALALLAAGFSERLAIAAVLPDFTGRVGVPAYHLSGLAAEATRVEKRISDLERVAAAGPSAPEQIGDVRIEESENRVRLYFPSKPSDSARGALKARGFRWSPTAGAWQRQASAGAWGAARELAETLAKASA